MFDEVYVTQEVQNAFPELSEEDQERIVELLRRIMAEANGVAK